MSTIFNNYLTYFEYGQYFKAFKCSTILKIYAAKYTKLLEVTIQQHKRATKIQACIQDLLSRKQHHQQFNVLPDSISQQGHVKEMLQFDDLLSNFMSDFDAITNKF